MLELPVAEDVVDHASLHNVSRFRHYLEHAFELRVRRWQRDIGAGLDEGCLDREMGVLLAELGVAGRIRQDIEKILLGSFAGRASSSGLVNHLGRFQRHGAMITPLLAAEGAVDEPDGTLARFMIRM